MPNPTSPENSGKKRKVRAMISEITTRTIGALAAKLLADAVREVWNWLTS